MNTNTDLEQRIVDALADDDISSAQLRTLLSETLGAADEAGQLAQIKRAHAEDLTLAPDGEKAQQEALVASLACKRLCKALDRLKKKLAAAEAKEYVERWAPEFERVEAQSNELKTEFAKMYDEYANKLIDLFQQVAECDRQIANINNNAPRGDRRRVVHPVDATFMAAVRLPALDSAAMLWPPPVKTLSQQFAEAMINQTVAASPLGKVEHRGADWWRAAAADRPRRIEEINHAATIENQNAQEREDRENAERYAANEARRGQRR